jgi:hypothetical protein
MLVLGSLGGYLAEAMRLGRLVRELRYTVLAPVLHPTLDKLNFETEDPQNDRSASACFFIYMGGINRGGYGIGIHRPYLPDEQYKSMSADDAMTESGKVRKIVTDYLFEMGVPSSYGERMFTIPSGEIVWLTEEEIFETLHGYVPDIQEWMSAQCGVLTEAEAMIYNTPGVWEAYSDVEKTLWQQARDHDNKISQCEWDTQRFLICNAWNTRHGAQYNCELP